MAFCLGDIHIWSLKNQTTITDADIGCFTYHEKNEAASSDHPYAEEKIAYTEGRNVTWSTRNKRPDKLRDTLKEVEDLLSMYKCIRSKWLSRHLLQFILSNGIVISMIVSIHTGDVDRIFIDKSLSGKLSSENPTDDSSMHIRSSSSGIRAQSFLPLWNAFYISTYLSIGRFGVNKTQIQQTIKHKVEYMMTFEDNTASSHKRPCICLNGDELEAILTEAYVAFVYSDKSKIDYFYFMKRPTGDKKIEKLSSYEPKLIQVDLPGPVGRRLNRRLICNLHQDMIVCWWPTAAGEAQPWSPMVSEKERANLVLFSAIGQRFNILTYTKTDCDPIGIVFSLLQPARLLTLEQWCGPAGEVNINTCVYECIRSRVHRQSLTTVTLTSDATCYNRNLTEDKILVGCEDGSIVLYDEYKKVKHVTKATLVPSIIRWHPSDTIVVVCNSRGDIQLFDLTLSPLAYQLVAERAQPTKMLQIAHYLRLPSSLGIMQWSPLVDHPENKMAECNDALFMMFDRGPMVMLQFYLGVLSNGILSPLSLVHQYIKYRQLDEAIKLLCGLNWSMEGQTCYACLSAIVNHLLRQPLNANRESQLETVLGTFYAPIRPLSEGTVLEYRDAISRLARRFFHHLLRFSRFEKAFLLAVDIGARDLFMDIHYIAQDRGETALAEAAKNKAQQIDAELLVSESVDDEEYSEDSEVSFTDSDDEHSNDDDIPRELVHGVHHPGMRHVVTEQRGTAYRRTPHPSQLPISQQPFPPVWPAQYINMPENVVQELEAKLTSELVDEYTEVLMDETILPPPPSHADPPEEPESSSTKASSNVKVIHFGLV
ncbi:hypothetical protein LSH36_1g25000 [Paralvinella palmiformis]|uniref:WD repeat-containing and planar cell polarity effector protein fritz n=1 Tax=Paralvinella palmiformis TaxID=53620 RepID=A0AAD9KFJ6_9ANNE|nr:hypothetical protein LSH36_1g25000 [Paralvinella palmiformis]